MTMLQVSVSRRIPAPPHMVYTIVVAYPNGHRGLLPPKRFPMLGVLEDGGEAGLATQINGNNDVL